MAKGIYLTAPQIDSAVRELYAKNGFVMLSEVRNGTGFEKRQVRTADMLAISTWPSRGIFAEGFEIKVSKTDLQRELQNPVKADEIAKYCTSWWLAMPNGLDEGLMIPPNWGIITVDLKNDKLKATVVRRGVPLQAEPMDTLFCCSVLRNFAECYVPKSSIQKCIEDAAKKAREGSERHKTDQHKRLEALVKEFTQHTGIDLMEYQFRTWDLRDIGAAVNALREYRARPDEELQRARNMLQHSIEALEGGLKALDLAAELNNRSAPLVELDASRHSTKEVA